MDDIEMVEIGTPFPPSFTSSSFTMDDIEMGELGIPLPRSFTLNLLGSLPSRLDRKIKDPLDTVIGYSFLPRDPIYIFIVRFVFFFIYCLLVSVCFENLGQLCQDTTPSRHDSLFWSETMVTVALVACTLHAAVNHRSARAAMQNVHQASVDIAWYILKTTRHKHGMNQDDLQVAIYECLSLLVLHTVTLVEDLRGNTCQPDVTQYAKQLAEALKRIQDGEQFEIRGTEVNKQYRNGEVFRFRNVSHYFEVNALHLHREFNTQKMRIERPSSLPQHMVSCLRGLVNNLIMEGNVDITMAPIIREHVDILARASKGCGTFSRLNGAMITIPRVIHLCTWTIALYSPIKHCDLVVNWTGDPQDSTPYPSVVGILQMSMIYATLTTMLTEIWRLFDPYGTGTNVYAWTLGIANDIDDMLHDYADTEDIICKHGYM